MSESRRRRRAEQGVLVVIGDLVEDVIVWQGAQIRNGTDNRAAVHRSRGGSAANVAAFAADLVSSRFIGCIGDDAAGNVLVAELESRGVDVRVQRRGSTGCIVILVDDKGERTMFPDRGAAGQLEAIDENWLVSAGCLHVPSYCFASEPTATSSMNFIAAARARGVPVSMDASSTGMIRDYGLDRYLQLLEAIQPQLYFANAEEAELLDLANDRFSATLTIVKDGSSPTVVHPVFGSPMTFDVEPVEGVRDSTGAGDAFAAGFISAWLRRADTSECVQAGHSAAQTVLRSPGARSA